MSGKGNGNSGMIDAFRDKKDEFYTSLTDIEKELSHYKAFFKGKKVLCNCDDPYESEFFHYFALNFNSLGLSRLTATCYSGSPIQGEQLLLPSFESRDEKGLPVRKPYKVVITEVTDENGDGRVDFSDVEYLIRNRKNVLTTLEGNGDFRSTECVELLKDADVVVTNPPFSLFREYVAQLVKYEKKFLIIGRQAAAGYKEIFALLMKNLIWQGYGFPGAAGYFRSYYEDKAASSQHKAGMIRVPGVTWYTNIDYVDRHKPIVPTKHYTPEEYPRYDNYDAIEVDSVKRIPDGYDGVMGVPVTFLDKYCPEQFEILGMCENEDLYGLKTRWYTTEERKAAYFAKFGKKGTYDLNRSAVLKDENGVLTQCFTRLLIRYRSALGQ